MQVSGTERGFPVAMEQHEFNVDGIPRKGGNEAL